MVANVGRLNVDLVARTGQFTRGLKTAQTSVQAFRAAIAGIKRGIVAGLAFVGVIAALNKLRQAFDSVTNKVKESFQEIDKLAKSADKLSVTTEQMAGLGLAASITGTDISTLEKGMERLQRNISEAATGTGEAVDTLKELGLNAVLLNQMLPYDQLLVVADAMGRMTNRTDQLRVAMELLGRGGAPAVNLLRTGAQGIEAFTQEAKDLGTAVSRVDAAKVEIANDAVTRAKEALKGFYNTVAIEIAPAVTVLAEKMTNAFKEMNRSIDLAETGLLKIDQVVARIGHEYDRVRTIIKMMGLEGEKVVATFKYLAQIKPWNPIESWGLIKKWREEMDAIEAKLQGVALGSLFGAAASGGTGNRMVKALDDVKNRAQETADAIQFSAGNATILADEAERAASALTGGGLAQGSFAQAMGAVGQSGISAAANRMAQRALDYAQQQVDHLAAIRQNTGKAQYAVAAPG